MKKIEKIYTRLCKKYGKAEKFWPQWCAKEKTDYTRELVAIGAILTQRTSWYNANLALKNLKKEELLSLKKLSGIEGPEKIKELIKPAGFWQTKPRRIINFSSFVVEKYKSLEIFAREDLDMAREKLLGLYGIGPETADTILLYAMDRPTFVIDEYTRRLARQERLSDNLSYNFLKELFEKSLAKDTIVFQNFHTLIIVDQKGVKGSLMEII